MDHSASLDVHVEFDVYDGTCTDTYTEYFSITVPNSRLMTMDVQQRKDIVTKVTHQYVYNNKDIQGTVKDVRLMSENVQLNHDPKSTNFMV